MLPDSRLPEENYPERIVDAELVDDARRGDFGVPALSWWKKTAVRLALALFIILLALGFIAVGVVLTLSVIGAFLGIPLVLLGLGFLVAAVLVFFGGGKTRFVTLCGFDVRQSHD